MINIEFFFTQKKKKKGGDYFVTVPESINGFVNPFDTDDKDKINCIYQVIQQVWMLKMLFSELMEGVKQQNRNSFCTGLENN
jgi:hypothetical protein